MNISPERIAVVELDVLDEIIRKNEAFVKIQIDNIRAIDSRATVLMTGTGLTISIMVGLISALFRSSVSSATSCLMKISFMPIGFVCIFCLLKCLCIIQSAPMNPIGNDGRELLIDVSNRYSRHEERVDYIFALSNSREKNEKLIDRHGVHLKHASVAFFLIFMGIISFLCVNIFLN
ncbi:MAG: hypothetical protein ACSHXY_04965 [Alphaproteobacteria bacterium]